MERIYFKDIKETLPFLEKSVFIQDNEIDWFHLKGIDLEKNLLLINNQYYDFKEVSVLISQEYFDCIIKEYTNLSKRISIAIGEQILNSIKCGRDID